MMIRPHADTVGIPSRTHTSLSSLHVSAGRHGLAPAMHPLSTHTSAPLQNNPSSQSFVSSLGCSQVPAPSHTSSVHGLPSSGQGVPDGSGLSRHVPKPSQVVGLSPSASAGSPQAVLAGSGRCSHTSLIQTSSVHSTPSSAQGVPSIAATHSFGRALAKIVSVLTFLVGYLMIAFDHQKRGLHDRIAGTLHVYAIP